MARELFVDTGAWVALADADDQHHARAAAFLPTALAEYQRLVTTDLVVAERSGGCGGGDAAGGHSQDRGAGDGDAELPVGAFLVR